HQRRGRGSGRCANQDRDCCLLGCSEQARKRTEIKMAEIHALTVEMLERVVTLTTPHMKTLNDDIAAAFPEHPDAMYTVAMAVNLMTLLQALHPADRPAAIDLLNQLLTKSGYRLIASS